MKNSPWRRMSGAIHEVYFLGSKMCILISLHWQCEPHFLLRNSPFSWGWKQQRRPPVGVSVQRKRNIVFNKNVSLKFWRVPILMLNSRLPYPSISVFFFFCECEWNCNPLLDRIFVLFSFHWIDSFEHKYQNATLSNWARRRGPLGIFYLWQRKVHTTIFALLPSFILYCSRFTLNAVRGIYWRLIYYIKSFCSEK